MSALVWSWPGYEPKVRRLAVKQDEPCADCGLPHTQARRLAILRRMLPATAIDIADAWPHFWATVEDRGVRTAPRRLFRDLRALGAIKPAIAGGEWRLP